MAQTTKYRSIECPISVRADGDTATAVLATSAPLARYGIMEILQIDRDSIDLSRSPFPLLLAHKADESPIGVVDDVRIQDGELIGTLRFGESERAQEALRDARAGVLRSVSIGYRIDETDQKYGHTIATKWTLLEVSLVSVPADQNARITQIRSNGDSKMNTVENYQRETAEIFGIAKRHNRMDLAEQALSKGMSLSQFRGFILDQLEDKPLNLMDVEDIGLSKRETRDFSLARAIEAKCSGDWRRAGLEKEVLETTRKRARHPDSIVLPGEVMKNYSKRDITLGSPSNGANLVETTVLGGSFIDALVASSVVLERCTTLSGLEGDVALPKASTGTSANWYTETGQLSESTPSFTQVTLSPKTVASFLEISRRTIQQSSPDIEALLRADMARQIASAIDAVILEGGGANQPTGVLQTNGIGSVALGTNGGAITYSALVDLVSAVEQQNALTGSLAFVTDPKVVAAMRQTPRQSGGVEANFILNADNSVLGHNVLSTTNSPSDLTKGTSSSVCSAVTFGNWSDVIVGFWSSGEFLVDNFTKMDQNIIRIRGLSDIDVAVRNVESFAAITDVTTA